MASLLHGNAHRSSSDRLLNNHLDAQKSLSASLLNLLSHSHSSTSSLLAYVTSSPGVVPQVRRAVRHAAFEGPLSAHLIDNADGSVNGDEEAPGWATYISSLEDFRKDLKQIHLLEEEMSRVKRDREILVTRLIKTTKSRPKKSDLTALAGEYRSPSSMSSRSSVISFSSQGSAATKEGKRAGKLADAQAELLGCEEHLRALEMRIEHERNHVMSRGLEERFRAMEAVGRMWVRQAHRGLNDLEKGHELPPNAFEVDSNGSMTPSQSASQIGFDEQHYRAPPRARGTLHGAGSITGSIAEEPEDSSDDDAAGKLVVHENRRAGAMSPANPAARSNGPAKPAPVGVPSVTSWQNDNARAGGRRAASDIGVGGRGYTSPRQRQPLRRHNSEDRTANSDTSSIRAHKKKGFFSSIARFFKGPKREGRSGRDSPPYGSGSRGGWNTRTDSNIKRQSTLRGRGRGGDDSSSDEEQGNLVSVANNRNNTWSVDNVGRPNGNVGGQVKRSSTMPIASGLIPSKPTRSGSQSTLTAKRATSPTPSGAKTPTQRPLSRASTLKSAAPGSVPAPAGGISRSNTVKSTSTVKSTGTVRSSGTAATGTKAKRASQNGNITRAALETQQAAEGRNIMSLVDLQQPPPMPEVPKAPKSQVTPQLELPKAPGSSIVRADTISAKPNGNASTGGNAPPAIKRSNSARTANTVKSEPARATTPLPPSRLLSPPLKSALRPTSPQPGIDARPTSPTPVSNKAPEKPIQMFSITAPGPVQLPEEPQPEARSFNSLGLGAPISTKPNSPTAAAARAVSSKPPINTRNSYHSMTTDGESVYESAAENADDDEDDDGRPIGLARPAVEAQSRPADDESSSEEEDESRYQVYENERSLRAGLNVGPPRVEKIIRYQHDDYDHDDGESDLTATGAGGLAPGNTVTGDGASTVSKRKSVRINPAPLPVIQAPAPLTKDGLDYSQSQSNQEDYGRTDGRGSPEPQRPTSGPWSSRIGNADISSDDEEDDGYNRARKGLSKNTGKWENVKSATSSTGKALGSLGRKKSTRSSKSGNTRG